MKVLKVSLIILASVVGAVGVILLGLFLAGKFNEPVYMPDDIFFANQVVLEDGTTSYEQFDGDYKACGNFDVILSTKTEVVNKTDVSLFFNTKNDVVKYLKKDAEGASANFYAYEDGNLSKFITCKEDEADYVTNGKIILPKSVKLNKTFTVLVCVAPDDVNAKITGDTSLYAVNGKSTFYAQSENVNITAISKSVYVDTPVSEIKLALETRNGGNETELSKVDGSYIVNLETYFSANAIFVPARSEYLYGNTQNKKTVVFALNNDENKISFVDGSDNIISVKTAKDLNLYSLSTGETTIFAYALKNASDYEELGTDAGVETLLVEMQKDSKGVRANVNVKVSKIAIDGFSVDEELINESTNLSFEINKAQIVSANGNNPANINLGINIDANGYSAGSIQKEVENMCLSVQVYDGNSWVDATKTLKLFEIEGDAFTISDEDNAFFGFDFYKINFNEAKPNDSYWKIVPLFENESASGQIRMVVCYFSDDEIVLENSKFGPYIINCHTEEVVETIVNWGETDLKFSNELPQGETNEKIFFVEDGVVSFVSFDLSNLAVISNLSANPTYTLVKFFAYSTDDSLETKINCKKYNFEISGVPSSVNGKDVYIYEILSGETLNVNSMGEKSSFSFNLFFALVKNDSLDKPILNEDGSYKIISVSNNNEGTLVYIPISISKIVDLTNDCLSVEILEDLSAQFGEDGSGYILQRTENCLNLSIKIKTEDFEIFKRQVELGNITLSSKLENDEDFNAFYLKSDDGNISLENALAYSLEHNSFNEENGEYVVSIALSTDSVLFAQNNPTKFVRINLTYSVNDENNHTIKTISRTTPVVKVYSGMIDISTLTVKDSEGNDIKNETISVSNKIDRSGESAQVVRTFKIGDKPLTFTDNKIEISSAKFEINDEILITSNRPDILLIDSNNVFSILKSGIATLTIKPAFGVSDESITVTFNIDSNFSLDADDTAKRSNFAKDEDNKSKGVVSYANGAYTIVGISGESFKFTDMVGLELNVNGGTIDITDKLTFTLAETDPTLSTSFIDFTASGFKFTRNFGVPASFTVYYYSTEYGFNSGVLQINVAPFYIANVNLLDDEEARAYIPAETLEDAEADAKFVFAEHNIDFSSFEIYSYNLTTKAYDTLVSSITALYNEHSLLSDNGYTFTDEIATYSKTETAQYMTTLNFVAVDGRKVEGCKVDGCKKVLITIRDASEDYNKFDFSVTYVFYVVPNIKVNENIASTIDENGVYHLNTENKPYKDENGVYHLNTENNPYKNGEIISWETNDEISFERIFIMFERICAGNEIDAGLFTYSFGKSGGESVGEQGTSITLGGITKLSKFKLSVSYAGKEFEFEFFAEPDITPSITDTVTYNGEEYLALFAGEDVKSFSNARFGNLASGEKIVSVNVLQNLNGTNVFSDGDYKLFNKNDIKNGKDIKIEKDENDLFITNIVFVDGEGNYITRKAIIFPEQWSSEEKWSYISYFNSENKEISGLTVDEILSGKVVKKEEGKPNSYNSIASGTDISNFASILTGKDYSYSIYNITNGEEKIFEKGSNEYNNVDYIYIKNNTIKTNHSGITRTYRIDFTVSYTTETAGLNPFNYHFSYYITVEDNQTIEINYPFAGAELHRVYYSQFENNKFVIDLKSKTNNLQNKNYVVLKNGSDEANLNLLSFAIESFKINNQEREFNGNGIVSLDKEKGVLTISTENRTNALNICIKVFTNTGTEAFYNIEVCSDSFNNYIVGSYTQNTQSDPITFKTKFNLNEITEQTKFDGKNLFVMKTEGDNKDNRVFNLSIFKLFDKNNSHRESPELKFAFINDAGVVQTSENLAYAYIEGSNLVVKPSPNTVSGKLVFYTSEGIVLTTKVTIASPISVVQTGASDVYAGQEINLSSYIEAKFNGGAPITGLDYEFAIDENFGNKISLEDNICQILSTDKGYTLTIYAKVYGDSLPGTSGTSETKPATLTLTFNVLANVVVSEQEIEVFANSETNIGIYSKLFDESNLFNIYNKYGINTLDKIGMNGSTSGLRNIDILSINLNQLSTDEKNAWFEKFRDKLSENPNIMGHEGDVYSIFTSRRPRTDVCYDVQSLMNAYPLDSLTEGQILKLYNIFTASSQEEYNIKQYYKLSEYYNIYSDEALSLLICNIAGEQLGAFEEYTSNTDTYFNITFKSGPVAVQKTILITLKLTTTDNQAFESTLKISIKPDTNVVINYPDYETGQNLDYHLISWDDWVDTPLTILNNELVVVNDISEAESPTHTTELSCSSAYVDLVPTGENESKTGIQLKGSKPTQELDIAVQIWVDGIFRENYYIKVRPSAVFTAKFNNQQNVTTEYLVDNIASKKLTLFNSTDGLFFVKTKENRAGSDFSLKIVAVDRRTEARYITTVYGSGAEEETFAKLFRKYENNLLQDEFTPIEGPDDANGYSYTLKELFKGIIEDIDMFDFYIMPFADDYVGEDEIFALEADVHMEAPTQRLTFFFNGKQIPLSVAKDLVELKTSLLSGTGETNVSSISSVEKFTETDVLSKEIWANGIKLSGEFIKDNLADLSFVLSDGGYVLDESYNLSKQNNNFVAGDIEIVVNKKSSGKQIGKIIITISEDKVNTKVSGEALLEQDLINFKLEDLGNLTANKTYEVKFKLASGKKTELATYKFELKKDYLISNTNYDVIKSVNTTSGSANVSYNAGEFGGYSSLLSTKTLKVLKTIELAVSDGERDLIDLLKANLGLTNLAGGNYANNLAVSLDYGKYNTNSHVTPQTLLTLQAKTKGVETYSYSITPHGAQNDGDIVHLVLSWNDGSDLSDADTYILRIKIIPNNPINLVEPSGIVNMAYGVVGGNTLTSPQILSGTEFEIPLSNLVSLNGITENEVLVAVGEGSEYVVGSGSNRLVDITENVKGFKLKKTIFGGNVIELTISDSFGYSVNVSIVYSNADQTSPTIVSTPNSIYEGESFTLAFDVGEGNYVVYKKSETPAWSKVPSTALENETNVIIIGNFGGSTLKALLLNGEVVSNKLSTHSLSASNVASAFNSGTSVVTANYISNTLYGGGISISGDALGLKLVLETNNPAIGGTERVELPISTALNERYQVQLKGDYANYADLYFGLGRTFNFSDIFQIWDLKDQKVETDVSLSDFGIDDTSHFGNITTTFTTKTPETTMSFTNKLADIGNVTFTMNVDSNKHKLSYNVYFTPKYYAILYPSTYNANYGVVVDGNENETSSNFGTWSSGFKLVDYYGKEVGTNSSLSSNEISLEKLQGTGVLDNKNLSNLSADNPVTISVKSNDVSIGRVLVTLRRYYALAGIGEKNNITPTQTNTLNFEVWANGIIAKVVGTTTEEPIPSGLSHFEFVAGTGYSVIYTGGEYKLRKTTGNFKVQDKTIIAVSYLGKSLGTFKVSIDSASVVVVKSNFSFAGLAGGGVTERELTNTISADEWTKGISALLDENDTSGISLKYVLDYFDITVGDSYSINSTTYAISKSGAFAAGTTVDVTIKKKKDTNNFAKVKILILNGKIISYVDGTKFLSIVGGEKTAIDDITSINEIALENWACGISAIIESGGAYVSLVDCVNRVSDFSFEITTGYTFDTTTKKITKSSGSFAVGDEIVVTVKYKNEAIGYVRVVVGNGEIICLSVDERAASFEGIKNSTITANASSIPFADWIGNATAVVNDNLKIKIADYKNLFTFNTPIGYSVNATTFALNKTEGNFADGKITITVKFKYGVDKSSEQNIGNIVVLIEGTKIISYVETTQFKGLTVGEENSTTYNEVNELSIEAWAKSVKVKLSETETINLKDYFELFEFEVPSGYELDGSNLKKNSGNFVVGTINVVVKYNDGQIGIIRLSFGASNVVVNVFNN